VAEITREHLELAALAAGKTILYWADAGRPVVNEDRNGVRGQFLWRPHLDDGDAARLAVRLGIAVQPLVSYESVTAWRGPIVARAKHNGTERDELLAWREAVVLCAAAVGERMRNGGA